MKAGVIYLRMTMWGDGLGREPGESSARCFCLWAAEEKPFPPMVVLISYSFYCLLNSFSRSLSFLMDFSFLMFSLIPENIFVFFPPNLHFLMLGGLFKFFEDQRKKIGEYHLSQPQTRISVYYSL